MNSYNNRFGIQLFTARKKMLMEIRILLTLFKAKKRREKWPLELKSELDGASPNGPPHSTTPPPIRTQGPNQGSSHLDAGWDLALHVAHPVPTRGPATLSPPFLSGAPGA